jgi:hypothetical protein
LAATIGGYSRARSARLAVDVNMPVEPWILLTSPEAWSNPGIFDRRLLAARHPATRWHPNGHPGSLSLP